MRRWLRHAHTAAIVLATAAFAGVFLLFIVGVGFRYLGGVSLTWTAELAVILFLWTVFVGAGVAVPLDDHVRVDALEAILPERVARLATAAALAAVGLLFLATLPWVYDYLAFLWRERTSVLRWRFDRVYLCFSLFQGAIGLALVARAGVLALGRGR